MSTEFQFYIAVYENGNQSVQSVSTKADSNMIGLILREFGHSVREMKWFKSEFNKELSKDKRNSWGHNNLNMIIDKEFCDVGSEFGLIGMQKISTELIKKYVDESIIFLDKYYSNKISGLELKFNKELD